MVEKNNDNGIIVLGKTKLYETHRGSVLESIPSDDSSNIYMNIQWAFGDAFIGMDSLDPEKFIYLPPMRFRTHYGGGNLPMIANELSSLPQGFRDTRGISLEEPVRFAEKIKSFDPIHFFKGHKEDDFMLSIKDITDDDEVMGEWTKFMDIDLLTNEDIRVTMRNTTYENKASMVFKTAENNGQFPVMATVFKRIGNELQKSRR